MGKLLPLLFALFPDDHQEKHTEGKNWHCWCGNVRAPQYFTASRWKYSP